MSTFENKRPFPIKLKINDTVYKIKGHQKIEIDHIRPRKIYLVQKIGGISKIIEFSEDEAHLFDFEIVKEKYFKTIRFSFDLTYVVIMCFIFYKIKTPSLFLISFSILLICIQALRFYYNSEIIIKKKNLKIPSYN